MAENKVQFNLKNVHYAVLTEGVGVGGAPTYTYGTPVAVPGAVSLSLDAEGGVTPFYADGIVYYQSTANNGYTGDLEMARFPDAMYQAIWGFELDSADKVLTETNGAETVYFALLYQIDGDAENQLYCLYKCSATRPGIGSETNTDSKEPKTQTSSISAIPRGDGKIFARTTDSTTSTVKSGWFTSVYE